MPDQAENAALRDAFREGARAVLDLISRTPWVVRAWRIEQQAALYPLDVPDLDISFRWAGVDSAAHKRFPDPPADIPQ